MHRIKIAKSVHMCEALAKAKEVRGGVNITAGLAGLCVSQALVLTLASNGDALHSDLKERTCVQGTSQGGGK